MPHFNTKHGHAYGSKKGLPSPTYYSWQSMKIRCKRPKCNGYKYYGGKGIKVCKRWELFQNFLEDMGVRPEGKTLGRISNNKNYSKSNCKWETSQEQNRKTPKRTDKKYSSQYKGVSHTKRKLSKKWIAAIHINGTSKNLGYFKTEEAAALAYNKKALELWGKDAHLNNIQGVEYARKTFGDNTGPFRVKKH